MSTRAPSSAALPIAYLALRALIVGNLLMGAGIMILLLIAPHERWILISMDLSPSPEADRVVMAFRAIAVLGLAAIPLNHIVLARLRAMVETVRGGDPFVTANAERLQTIAWSLFALQVLSILIGWIAGGIAVPGHPVDINAGFSVHGWLAVLLTFLLARVFAEGAHMRDDLEGTV